MKTGKTLTAEQMRLLENTAMESGRVTGRVLMQRAGEGAVNAAFDLWPDLARGGHPALVLCGPGNNGGDGYVIARALLDRGWTVGLCALRPPLPGGDAAAAARDWQDAGGETHPLDDCAAMLAAALDRSGSGPVLVVDALLGIGQRRNADAILAPWWRALDAATRRNAAARLRLLAVDVPTGYDCDTGQALAERPFAADLVVSFHARKPVHDLLAKAGIATVVVPIGL